MIRFAFVTHKLINMGSFYISTNISVVLFLKLFNLAHSSVPQCAKLSVSNNQTCYIRNAYNGRVWSQPCMHTGRSCQHILLARTRLIRNVVFCGRRNALDSPPPLLPILSLHLAIYQPLPTHRHESILCTSWLSCKLRHVAYHVMPNLTTMLCLI